MATGDLNRNHVRECTAPLYLEPLPEYLARRLGAETAETWLISSNPFDVIGAKSAGLKAVWIRRKPDAQFDPWEIEPDLIVPDLERLAERL